MQGRGEHALKLQNLLLYTKLNLLLSQPIPHHNILSESERIQGMNGITGVGPVARGRPLSSSHCQVQDTNPEGGEGWKLKNKKEKKKKEKKSE